MRFQLTTMMMMMMMMMMTTVLLMGWWDVTILRHHWLAMLMSIFSPTWRGAYKIIWMYRTKTITAHETTVSSLMTSVNLLTLPKTGAERNTGVASSNGTVMVMMLLNITGGSTMKMMYP